MPITLAMIIELAVMGAILFTGVAYKIPGIPLAAITVSIASGADALYLFITPRKNKLKPEDK